MTATPEQLIRAEIRALTAYHVPDPGGCIKLDAMENPWPWPGELTEQWLQMLRGLEVNRYPDPAARELTAVLRAFLHLPDGMQLVLGNGSDELIQMILLAVARPDRVVLAPEPTFVMYRMIAEVVGMRYAGVPLAEDFSLDADALFAAVDRHRPAVVFLAYPNNPTGNLFDAGVMEELLRRAPGLVVVDEAYAPFTDASFLPRLGGFDNLLVLRTMSKMGLAGLRLGLLAGDPRWLGEIDKTRLPYNINSLTQASARFALEQAGVLQEQAQRIRAGRGELAARLAGLAGLRVYPSEANFILFRTPAGQAGRVFECLRERGLLIKNLSGAGGALADCLRVTVGTPAENAAFVEGLTACLSSMGET